MRIDRIVQQSRRDFTAVYKCEHCTHEHKGSGYDDANFHQNVIPDMVCDQCGKKAPSSYRALAPKHADDDII